MSSSVAHVAAGFVDSEAAGVREAVLAGPGVTAGLDERARSWLLERLLGSDAVLAALVSSGHVDVRRRALPGDVTVKVVLGLGLFSREGYDSVLAKVYPSVAPAPRVAVPTGAALSGARDRVDEKVFQALFRATATRPGPCPVTGVYEFGLELTAFDGTTFDLADTDAMRAWFATPTGGKHPQARVVTLTACGTRKVRAAAIGSYDTSEQELTDTLIGELAPGTLNLADRNFFSMARFLACAATGAQLAWRVKNSNKHLPAKVTATLPDGSQLVRQHESDGMLARRRRKAGTYSLPRLPDTIARLVEFDLFVKDERGRTRRSRFRILTTLLDHHAYPAQAIAAVYAQRWQAVMRSVKLSACLVSHRRSFRRRGAVSRVGAVRAPSGSARRELVDFGESVSTVGRSPLWRHGSIRRTCDAPAALGRRTCRGVATSVATPRHVAVGCSDVVLIGRTSGSGAGCRAGLPGEVFGVGSAPGRQRGDVVAGVL
jgi:hypothetical protein